MIDVVSDSPVLEYSTRLSSMQPSASPPLPIRISVSRTSTTVTSDMPASVGGDSPSLPSVAISSSTAVEFPDPAPPSGDGVGEGNGVDDTEHLDPETLRNPTPHSDSDSRSRCYIHYREFNPPQHSTPSSIPHQHLCGFRASLIAYTSHFL